MLERRNTEAKRRQVGCSLYKNALCEFCKRPSIPQSAFGYSGFLTTRLAQGLRPRDPADIRPNECERRGLGETEIDRSAKHHSPGAFDGWGACATERGRPGLEVRGIERLPAAPGAGSPGGVARERQCDRRAAPG